MKRFPGTAPYYLWRKWTSDPQQAYLDHLAYKQHNYSTPAIKRLLQYSLEISQGKKVPNYLLW